MRGPGITNLDFSVTKDTALRFLGEGGKLQFRAEFFNILNKANFATPALGGTNQNSAGILFAGATTTTTENPLPTAGIITNTATSARQVQLSLRLVF
jgi:hypothetical protein